MSDERTKRRGGDGRRVSRRPGKDGETNLAKRAGHPSSPPADEAGLEDRRAAVNAIFRSRFNDAVRRLIFAGASVGEAPELTQDAWLRAWRSPPERVTEAVLFSLRRINGRPASALGAVWLDHLRRVYRRREVYEQFDRLVRVWREVA